MDLWREVVQFITAHTPELLNLNVTRTNIVRAIGIKIPPGIGNFSRGTNESGIFMKTFKMNCPINKNRRQVYFYYVTEPGNKKVVMLLSERIHNITIWPARAAMDETKMRRMKTVYLDRLDPLLDRGVRCRFFDREDFALSIA
jgi:hypothetical protein